MIALFIQFAHQHPWVSIIALVGCIGIAFVVLVVWKEILTFEFWED